MADADLLARAREGDGEAFSELTGPYRHELLAHCYRMLASAQDAEDVAQETMLAAWQNLATFEKRFAPDMAIPHRHQPLPQRSAVR